MLLLNKVIELYLIKLVLICREYKYSLNDKALKLKHSSKIQEYLLKLTMNILQYQVQYQLNYQGYF
jgi:hypothetical protein